MATRKEIRISRRGAAAGTAVAAALLALNIGGGYLLLSGRANPENSMVATSDLAEQSTPLYVTKMQEYYTATSGIPCDFDFTGYGKDFGDSYVDVDEEYRITVTAVAGCDWFLYFFYDVEPLQGQDYWQLWSDHPFIRPVIRTPENDQINVGNSYNDMPMQDEEPADGIWHGYSYIVNITDIPFSAEGNVLQFCSDYLDYGTEPDPEYDWEILGEEPLDFLCYPEQLHELDTPWCYNFAEVHTDGEYVWEARQSCSEVEMTRFVTTPFGVFYFSDPYRSGASGHTMTGYTAANPNVCINVPFRFYQQDDALSVIDTFSMSERSVCGTIDDNGTAVSYVHMVFDHPWDAAKGQLVIEPIGDDSAAENDPITTDPAEDKTAEESAEAALQITDAETGEFIQPTQEQLDSLTNVEKGALVVIDAYWHRDVQIEAELQADGTVQLNYCNLLPEDVVRVNGDCELLISVSYNGEVIPIYDTLSGEASDSLYVRLAQRADVRIPFQIALSDIVGEDVNVTETYPLEISLMYRPLVTLDGEQNTKYFCAVKTYTLTNGG